MKKYRFMTPEGTKDFLFEECLLRRRTQTMLHELFQSKGYSELTTPGLEFMDLFQSKLGHYPPEALYKMTDSKGRLLVLRPESTVPIARVVATRLRHAPLPLRLYYSQPVYRFEPALKGRSDEVSQMGIELLGEASYLSDIEIVTTAIEALRTCSARKVDFSLEIGDAGIFKELMRELSVDADQSEQIRYLIETKNYPALGDLLDTLSDNSVTRALRQLPSLFGGEEVFDKAAQLVMNPRIDEILSDLKRLYGDIKTVIGDGKLTVDLGMVNNADYYSGVILKGYLEGYGEEILSGGRYNKLLSDFEYDIPAIGFAVNLDAVTKVLRKCCDVELKPVDVLIYTESGCEMRAVATSERLRAEGKNVEFSFLNTLEEAHEYAKLRGIATVYRVDENSGEVVS